MDEEQPEVPIFSIPNLDTTSLRIEPNFHFETAKPSDTVDYPVPSETVVRAPDDALEEIAEDMVDVVRRLGKLERLAQETASMVTSMRDSFAEQSSYQYRLVEALRRDLESERRGLALRSLFEATAGALDQLEMVGKGFDPVQHQEAYGQVAAAVATLSNLIQSLGFTRFLPQVGEAFDPARMQCLGYTPGEPGMVLQVLRPGYLAGGTLVRPSGVLIADPEIQRAAEAYSSGGEVEQCTK
jgi:molecular chaperone GrpE (heat shock protein)